ncbi:MAG: tRNA threonylcarbamoyladenosine dehydratase [Firmicutes bacterium]|nr:tRNA threonylcarbamoyladenosine dehydratase [Bacillota bacterium]
MNERYQRTELILGTAAMDKLRGCRVAVFGVGGVGGYVVEALARSGVGALDLIDCDKVDITNINRQIIALSSTVGQNKVDVAAARVKDIDPSINVTTHPVFYGPETEGDFDFTQYDYIVDAIDSVKGKIALAVNAEKCGVPIISSMGAGNKLDPTRFEVSDIYKTSVCPLARVMRKELKERGIKKLKVVYSKEPPIAVSRPAMDGSAGGCPACSEGARAGNKRPVPGSISFVPSVCGLVIAGEVIKDLIK